MKREVRLAKTLLESKGYTVSKRLKESAWTAEESGRYWSANIHGHSCEIECEEIHGIHGEGRGRQYYSIVDDEEIDNGGATTLQQAKKAISDYIKSSKGTN